MATNDFSGRGLPAQALPENQDSETRYEIDERTGVKTELNEDGSKKESADSSKDADAEQRQQGDEEAKGDENTSSGRRGGARRKAGSGDSGSA